MAVGRDAINKRKLALAFKTVFDFMSFAIITLESEPNKYVAGTKSHSIIFLSHF